MHPASRLLTIVEGAGQNLDFVALRDALSITQPLRHARADDEYLLPVQRHLAALVKSDDHPALRILDPARSAAHVDLLVVDLYMEAAGEATGLYAMSPKDRLDQPDPEECDECGRATFLPSGIDEFGGTNSPGRCVACGYERDAEKARELAIDAEWERVKDRD